MSEQQSTKVEKLTNDANLDVNVNSNMGKNDKNHTVDNQDNATEEEPQFIVNLDDNNDEKVELPYSAPSPVTNLMLMSAEENTSKPCVNVKRYEGSDHYQKHEELYKTFPSLSKRLVARLFIQNLYDFDKTSKELREIVKENEKAKTHIKLVKPNEAIAGNKVESVRCYKGLTNNFNVFSPELCKANRPDGRSVRGGSAYFYRKVEIDSNGVVVQCPKGTGRVIEDMMQATKTVRLGRHERFDDNAASQPLQEVNVDQLIKEKMSSRVIPTKTYGSLQKGLLNKSLNGSQHEFKSDPSPVKTPGQEKKFFKNKRRSNVETRKAYREKDADKSIDDDKSNMQATPKLGTRIQDLQATKLKTHFSNVLNNDEKDEMIHFFNTANLSELCLLPGCSLKSSEQIISSRPFTNMEDLEQRVGSTKNQCSQFISGYKDILQMRKNVNELISVCQEITNKIQDKVGALLACSTSMPNEDELQTMRKSISQDMDAGTKPLEFLKEQPRLLNPELTLKPYQMVGVNWLNILHHENLNSILADEMGLGKTIQAISFLAHIKDLEDSGPNLVICPSSTLDNWAREFQLWFPSVNIIIYSGQIEERRDMRLKIRKKTEKFDVLLTSYSIGTSSVEDRTFMKQLEFNYGIFDEAHMLKNITSVRFKALMNFKVKRKILLTGTPIQNNLVELMSLLHFVLPELTSQSLDLLKRMFQLYCNNKTKGEVRFESECVMKAKNLLKPFCLRRLKNDVLSQLPKKTEEIIYVDMSESQKKHYRDLIKTFKAQKDVEANENSSKRTRTEKAAQSSGSVSAICKLMELRKVGNHPMLGSRLYYSLADLTKIAKTLKKDKSHRDADEAYILEDLENLNDYQVHKICLTYDCIKDMALDEKLIEEVSGKICWLRENLSKMFAEDHRVLLFSQFVIVLSILEDFLKAEGIEYLRLDGSTERKERQLLIDNFNTDNSYKVFLLSTRAGGMGINLTGADTVILHDIDFNPYNDKQAEDRAHRLGQKKPVKIIRLISKGTIDEKMLVIAKEKLKLEENVTNTGSSIEGKNANGVKPENVDLDEDKEDKADEKENLEEENDAEFPELRVLSSPKKNTKRAKPSKDEEMDLPITKLDAKFAKKLMEELLNEDQNDNE